MQQITHQADGFHPTKAFFDLFTLSDPDFITIMAAVVPGQCDFGIIKKGGLRRLLKPSSFHFSRVHH
ncbi:MAG: hypothetical protein ABL869_01755 [Candidatus Nitrotoga sp.]